MTVQELLTWLADKPPDAEVCGYEGEHTGIVVKWDDAHGSKGVAFFPTRDTYGRENPEKELS